MVLLIMAKIQGTYIPADHHVFVAGRNGSGKTFLVRNYLAGYKNVFVLDIKGTLVWPEAAKDEVTIVTRLADVVKCKTPKCIYQPRPEEMTQEFYDLFFKFIYFRGHTIVWVDEVFGVSPNPHVIPFHYRAILTRGRELGVAAWSLSQRPSGIHLLPISEARHVLSFDLNLPKDRKTMSGVTGCEEFLDKPGKFKFWYYNTENDNAILAQLKL